MSSRSGFQAAVEGRNLGSVLGQAELPLDLFPAGDDGSRTLNFPLQAEDAPRDPNALQLRRTGVYPVEVELRQPDGTRLAGFVTPVVAVAPGANGGPAIGQRLGVSWVVPMTAPPAYQADGKPDPSVVSQLRPEGRLGRRAIAIANSGVPLTLAPGPETPRVVDPARRTATPASRPRSTRCETRSAGRRSWPAPTSPSTCARS